MLAENFNSIITFLAFMMGMISLILVWVYVIEAGRGIEVVGFSSYKQYVDTPYIFFLLINLIVWLTTAEADKNLFNSNLTMAILWILTVPVIVILSFFMNIDESGQKKMRSPILSCLLKSFISIVILMFIA